MILSIEDISKKFGGLTAIDQVNIGVRKGEIFSIIGPNGAGKTTLFNVLTGIYVPETGRIIMNGKNIVGLAPDRIAARRIARTFQNIRLFGSMTVYENIMVGLHLRTRYTYAEALLRMPRFFNAERESKEKARWLLDYAGLKHRASELARNLPYGEQRRLEIARALALDPVLLLLDEPAAGMNPHETADLTEFLRRLRREFDVTMVLIEHHMQVVMKISDRVAVLDYGRKIAEGTPAEVRENPDVIEAYLGKSGREEHV